ncbi:MAG: FKBP-type peptidyl-prolyl cis-trans isomerase [Bacteroidia bacterium]
MKFLHLLAVVAALFLVSCSGNQSGDTVTQSHDTITTASGLKYYYLTKGTGRQIEEKSEVSAYLELMVNDSVIWTTANPKDSLFVFYPGYDQLIKGFTEVSLLLKEGDEVVAIMPDSIAYGDQGAGELIPPNTTVVYNPMRIVKVTEPKIPLSESLYNSYGEGGLETMIENFETATTVDTAKYIHGVKEIFVFWEKLSIEERHADAALVASYFGERQNEVRLKYSAVLSYESMGDFEKAKEALLVINEEMPNVPLVQQKLMELEEKMAGGSAEAPAE